MQNHAIQLQELGCDVTAVGLEDEYLKPDKDGWKTTPLLTPQPHLAKLGFSVGLNAALFETDAHLAHLHGLWQFPSIAVSWWRHRTARPVIISTQGMLEPWALRNSRIKKMVAAHLFERANLARAAVIHCSESEVDGVREFGLRNAVAVLPNGVNLPETNQTEAPTWHEAGRKNLLFLGRIHPKKGLLETVSAFAELKRRRPDLVSQWQFIIAGWDDGGHELTLKRHVHSCNVQDDVQFVGQLYGAEKSAALSYADAFVLASYSEGFPMAVLEAWAHQLPVFMTRQCNIGVGFDRGAAIEVTTDTNQLAELFITHLARSDLPQIGAAGRQLVESEYAWPQIVSELHAVYEWALGQRVAPNCLKFANDSSRSPMIQNLRENA